VALRRIQAVTAANPKLSQRSAPARRDPLARPLAALSGTERPIVFHGLRPSAQAGFWRELRRSVEARERETRAEVVG
jgi:hypothetical protein